MTPVFDLVVRNGNIADGSGRALFKADIGIADGRIAALGENLGRGKEEVEARGRLVIPGFVDIHTHYDGQATWDCRMAPSSWHGVTTAVMGNCGVGFAPVKPEDRERLIELMEGVEDIPGPVLHEGLEWRWESFGEYLNILETVRRDIDIAAQLPHAALRVFVMGARATRLEPATEADTLRMRQLTADAMRAGAIGFSTSRTFLHKNARGDHTPSFHATEQELMAIAMGMADTGSGVIELISDFDDATDDEEFAMLRRLVTASGRPISLSLAQFHSRPHYWRKLLANIESARKDGLAMTGQVAPRPIGILLGLQLSRSPFMSLPSFRAIAGKSLAEKVAIMRDGSFRKKLMAESPLDPFRHANFTNAKYLFPFGDPPDYEPAAERSLEAMAKAANRDPLDLIYDMLIENEGRNFLFAPFANYADHNLDVCGEMIAHPDCVMGLSDGGAHVGFICDGSFPTFLLSHWGRDRDRGRFDVTALVKKQTLDTARTVGLFDRGAIRCGLKADLNVIDFDSLALEAPTVAFDLPAGGRRLVQKAKGYEATIVSGIVTYRGGEPTDALPGKLVRQKPRAACAKV